MRRLAPALLVAVSSCASMATLMPPHFVPEWSASLVQVERPAKARERYGPQALSTATDTGVTKYRFEDRLVSVTIFALSDRIGFNVENKTDNSVRLIWNDAAFVDIAGKSQPIMHEGIKYTDCAGNKTPSVIVRRGALADAAIPCGNVSFGYSSWVVSPLLPHDRLLAADTTNSLSHYREHVGKTVSLLLPLQIEDVVNDYLFTFRVDSVAIKPSRY